MFPLYSSVALIQLWVVGLPKPLRLPGTHGRMFPWDPPSFGIPNDVLTKVAAQLRWNAISYILDTISIDKSYQSSSTSSDEESEPDSCWVALSLTSSSG